MSSNGVVEAVVPSTVSAALTALTRAVDALQSADWAGCDDAGVLAVVRELEVQRRRLPTVDHALVAELEVRSVPATHLVRNTAHLLADVLHLDLPDARARVRAAADLGPRVTIGGDPQEPLHPFTARAQADGAISEKHAAVIARAVHGLPGGLDPEVTDAAERTLAEHAQHLPPAELTRAAERLAAHLDPDGSLTDDADRARRRHLTVGPQGSDGMSPVKGLLDPACRALLDAALAALARPAAEHDLPDPRSAGQRDYDALAALCQQLLADGSLPSSRGLPATVVITMSLDQLEQAMAAGARGAAPGRGAGSDHEAGSERGAGSNDGNWSGHGAVSRRSAGSQRGARDTGRGAGGTWDGWRRPNPDGATARTATGVDLPLPDALRLAADAHWVLGVLDRGGQPLFLSRAARLATAPQRLALIARDRGCTRPGCPAPPAWTEVHHLTEWQHGGGTDITNLALVCSYDHHLISHEGFTVRLGASGRIEWIPPAHLDPARTPRTNPLHHPPDLTTLEPSRAA